MIWTLLGLLCLLPLAALMLAVSWFVWLKRGHAKILADPHHHPHIRWRDDIPRSLRRDAFVEASIDLEERGFREIGTKVESVGLWSVPSREFVHPDGTVASIYSLLRSPARTFLSEFVGPITFIKTGAAPVRAKKHGTALIAGVDDRTLDPGQQLEAHHELVRRAIAESGSLQPVHCGGPEERMKQTRRLYIEWHTNDGTYFQPFQNPTRLKIPTP